MFLAIVLTANHYIIDAAAGGVVALFGLAASYMLRTWESPEPAAERSRVDRGGQ